MPVVLLGQKLQACASTDNSCQCTPLEPTKHTAKPIHDDANTPSRLSHRMRG